MKPSSAASIWIVDQTLHVEFPSTRTEKTHTIAIPVDETGLALAIQIFRARNAQSTVGTKGAPTKYQTEKALLKAADKFLKDGGKIKTTASHGASPEVRASVKDVLREIGLI